MVYLTTDIFSIKPVLADFINLAIVINSTTRIGLFAGNLLVERSLDIDVGAKVLVQGEEPVPDRVGIDSIFVEMFLHKDVGDGSQLHANDLGQIKVLLAPAWQKCSLNL